MFGFAGERQVPLCLEIKRSGGDNCNSFDGSFRSPCHLSDGPVLGSDGFQSRPSTLLGGGRTFKKPTFFGGGPLLELNCRRDINHFEEYVILPMNNTRKYYELLYYALNPLVLV